MFAKEGQGKSVLADYRAQRQATNRYFLGSLILSDPVLEVIRRVRIDTDDLHNELTQEVLKREVIEGDKADDPRRRISKAQERALRIKARDAAAG